MPLTNFAFVCFTGLRTGLRTVAMYWNIWNLLGSCNMYIFKGPAVHKVCMGRNRETEMSLKMNCVHVFHTSTFMCC